MVLQQNLLARNVKKIVAEECYPVDFVRVKDIQMLMQVANERKIFVVTNTKTKGFHKLVLAVIDANKRTNYPMFDIKMANNEMYTAEIEAKAYHLHRKIRNNTIREETLPTYEDIVWERMAKLEFESNMHKIEAYKEINSYVAACNMATSHMPLLEELNTSIPAYNEYQELSKDLLSLYLNCFNLKEAVKDKSYTCNPNPSFQRDFVWSEQMKVSLIESILAGIPIGTFYVNSNHYEDIETLGEGYGETLWEGKQRIHALHDFICGKFSVRIEDEDVFYAQAPTYFNKAIRGCNINVMQSSYRSLEDIIRSYVKTNQNKVAHKDEDYTKALEYLASKK